MRKKKKKVEYESAAKHKYSSLQSQAGCLFNYMYFSSYTNVLAC